MKVEAEASEARPEGAARVYIVDDDPLIHGVLRRILGRFEFDVVCFHSARTALAALESDPEVDVVLTDLSMPELDGFELLHRLRSMRPEIEVVMITGNAGIETAVTAVKAGAYHFISKPFDVETPVLIVRQALEHKRLLGHARALEQRLRERTAGGEGALLVGAGTAMRRVRNVRVLTGWCPPSAMVQRARLWAITAHANQAAFTR
jgi:DNA-binding NtrC family response regulator